jgi:NADH dehydrogenase
MDREKNTQIVVVGAGYAGIMATLRLSGKTQKSGATITLVNGVDHFVQRPRLHQVATDQAVPQKPIREMLRGHDVHFVQGWVTAVDPERHTIQVARDGADPQELVYDYLVYALGSTVDRDSVPGVREHAYTLDPRGPLAAPALCQKLAEMTGQSGHVVVVGSGPTGIEGATELKGMYPQVQVSLIAAGEFGTFKGARVAKHFRQAFAQQDIQIIENAPVEQIRAGEVILAGGKKIAADVILWAGGFRALPLARQAGLAVNQKDQILVDPYLRSVSHPDIYAVGDAAHTVEEPGNRLRMSLLTAITMAAHAADNLSRQLKGREQKPLSFAYYGQGIAMGPDGAVGFAGYPADDPIGPIVRGRLAVWIRAFFVWLIFYFLEVERRWPGFYFWLGKGRYAAARRAAGKAEPSELITRSTG